MVETVEVVYGEQTYEVTFRAGEVQMVERINVQRTRWGTSVTKRSDISRAWASGAMREAALQRPTTRAVIALARDRIAA